MLEIKDLSVAYGERVVLSGVDLTMKQGEIVALVGESGSGKTTVVRAAMGLLPSAGRIASGSITFEGRDVTHMTPHQWLDIRGKDMAMIFQDAGAFLDPIKTIGSQFVETLRAHRNMTKEEARNRAMELLKAMELPAVDRIMKAYPFELSGGQRQRVGIAMSMSFEPKLLIADEATSALDVTTQAQIVSQLMDLRRDYNTSILLVTHNLGVAAHMADQILVMRHGQVVDRGTVPEILSRTDGYTKLLLDTVPEMEGGRYV